MSEHDSRGSEGRALRGAVLALGLLCAPVAAADMQGGDAAQDVARAQAAAGDGAATQDGPTLLGTGLGERPWAQGVSLEQQAAAERVFREANGLLRESLFAPAAERYREALRLWDHPAIHYNLALALLNLDQPLQVHEHLVAAVRYGPAPLDQDKFENAGRYKGLVEMQLARLDISCDAPGASVVLDGKELFVGPGRYEGMVRAGPHVLMATKAGYVPADVSRSFAAGETARLDLRLYTAEQLTRYERRWAEWMPWTVLGSGVAVAAAGALFHLEARRNYGLFDTGIQECGGCVPPQGLTSRRMRGDTLQAVAIGGYALGGAALATGAVLLFLNRPIPIRLDPEAETAPQVTVAPLVGRGEGGVFALLRF